MSMEATWYRANEPPSFSECRWSRSPLERGWPTFTLAHYLDNARYAKFEGDDLTPWHHHMYNRFNLGARWVQNLRLRWPHELDEPLQYHECRQQHLATNRSTTGQARDGRAGGPAP